MALLVFAKFCKHRQREDVGCGALSFRQSARSVADKEVADVVADLSFLLLATLTLALLWLGLLRLLGGLTAACGFALFGLALFASLQNY